MRVEPVPGPSRSPRRGAAASWGELLVALLCLWAWTAPRSGPRESERRAIR